ncbi:hypothetical protein ECTPHS_10896 [Ectothiorhodospira sp. PHS-1]|uniref:hypothetical protein n=1 Tax=Ectothiorhodospira sp. PHS-1 TaxID=519989 RepID=UPI00024A8152|nr:hypothetical protein [Ectothiorhodospira sp. PHS-1]EHQ53190.1 hypothetical protein ECTPHS_10896 [Ectothiorhodospira sp. PHS-1]
MKEVRISRVSDIRNELNRYRKGKKFDIRQFNQVARLAWLGRVVMQPLDPDDKDCESFLLYVEAPDPLTAHCLEPDEDLVGRMHIVDGQQALALVQILKLGMEERVRLYEELAHSDFYFRHFS